MNEEELKPFIAKILSDYMGWDNISQDDLFTHDRIELILKRFEKYYKLMYWFAKLEDVVNVNQNEHYITRNDVWWYIRLSLATPYQKAYAACKVLMR